MDSRITSIPIPGMSAETRTDRARDARLATGHFPVLDRLMTLGAIGVPASGKHL